MKDRIDAVYDEIYKIALKTWCEDSQEVKDLALEYNRNASDEAREINKEAVIIDTCTFGLENYNWHLMESGATAINCTVTGIMDGAGAALNNIVNYYSSVNNSEKLSIVLKADDIIKCKETGRVGVIIGAQSCEFVQHMDIAAAVEAFANLGLRVMQIGYNHRTFAADGCYTGDDAGITDDGRKLIESMEHCGITVDLSHVGRRSTIEAMEMCKKPPVFTHSNPRSLFNHARNITDEQAKKCAALGGVIGVCSYNITLWDENSFPTIDNFIDAIEYYVNLIGIDHVGIGLDSNAQPGSYERREQLYFVNLMKEKYGTDSLYYKSYEAGRGILTMFTEGLLNISNFVCITDKLLKRGFSKVDIKKILGENWLRVFRQSWK